MAQTIDHNKQVNNANLPHQSQQSYHVFDYFLLSKDSKVFLMMSPIIKHFQSKSPLGYGLREFVISL